MAHSIELLFDPDSDAAIRDVWQLLADADLPSHMNVRSGTNRPHITLLAADRIDAGVDDVLAELCSALPLPCLIGAPMVFGDGRLTLVRSVVPSARLLALHHEVYQRCLPHVPGTPFAHCEPDQWSPHTTLGRRLSSIQLGQALSEVPGIGRDITAMATGLRRWDGDQREEHVLIAPD
jgi:hypothetical protein